MPRPYAAWTSLHNSTNGSWSLTREHCANFRTNGFTCRKILTHAWDSIVTRCSTCLCKSSALIVFVSSAHSMIFKTVFKRCKRRREMSLFVAGDSTSSSSSLLLSVTVSSAFCWSFSMSKSVYHAKSYYNWHELREIYTYFLRRVKGLVMVYPVLALLRLLPPDCRFAWFFPWFNLVLAFIFDLLFDQRSLLVSWNSPHLMELRLLSRECLLLKKIGLETIQAIFLFLWCQMKAQEAQQQTVQS